MAERLGRRLAGPALAELTSADTESWSHLDPVMVRWAASLAAAGVRTALLSNAPAELRDLIVGRFAWAAGLDQRTFSCEVGSVKPKPVSTSTASPASGSIRRVPCWWTTARSTSRAPSRSAWAAWSSPRRPWRATWPAAVCLSLFEQALQRAWSMATTSADQVSGVAP